MATIAPPAVAADPPAPVAGADRDEARRKIREMLARVSRARGLPVQREVPARVLDRGAMLERIRAHVAEEVPPDAVENEGELLVAFELVPPEYDFVEGSFALIQGRIAGFYEPGDHTMYLADDLDEREATETLAHELDHALQDQAFSLGKMIAYAPGDGDRTSAIQNVVEGDGMSAMFDVVAGSAFSVDEGALRKSLVDSNASSGVAATTPHVLQAALIAPYADGFSFVQRQRAAGGWPAVDAALRAPPVSTEQILHADKLASREPPIPVPVPTFAALGSGFRAVLDDVVGEQGLRLMLEEWTGADPAERGAAGWGGDRYVVARRDDAGARAVAVGWHVVMDTDADAAELAEVFAHRFGQKCRERPKLGPLAWRRRGRDLVFAAGPYVRRGREAAPSGSCAAAGKWIEEILHAAPKPP
jgi:hypothetical protein